MYFYFPKTQTKAQHATLSPPMQASCRGEAVREVRAGFALAPYCSKSLTHSKLPAEQASHSGVLPSTFLAST